MAEAATADVDDHLPYGGPRYPRRDIVARPASFVPAVERLGVYYTMTVEQQQYYRYWRQRLLKGDAMISDIGYVESLYHESPHFNKHFEGVLAEWESLYKHYPLLVSHGLIVNLCVARLIAGKPRFDDVRERLQTRETWIGFDLAVASGDRPREEDLADLVTAATSKFNWRDQKYVAQVVARIRASAPDDPIQAAALSDNPKAVRRQVFGTLWAFAHDAGKSGYPVRRGDSGSGFSATIPSYHDTARVKKVVRTLYDMAIDMTASASDDELVPTVTVPDTRKRVPIKKMPVSYPPADELDGLLATIRVALGWEPLLLLGVVLRLSEHKPWIEGKIALSKDLRTYVDRAIEAIGKRGGIGSLKRGFYLLTRGSRAVWTCDERLTNASEPKMNQTYARFTLGLQHVLIGSAAREIALREIEAALARQLCIDPVKVTNALAENTLRPLED